MSQWQIAQAQSATDKRHLFLVLPSYTGHIWVPTAASLIYNLWNLQETRVELCPILFDAQIAMSRSQAAMLFLASSASDMIMCDWDMVFSAPSIAQLISHPVDIVGCDYPRRTEPIGYSTRFLRDRSGKRFNVTPDENGLIEVEAVPTGLMKISRNAVEQMIEAYPDLHYIDELMPNKKGCALFSNLFENSRSWGEDISFCRRWRRIGGKVYLDPAIAIGHWGHKQFTGDYNHWLKAMAKADPDAPEFLN
jgi:hypothetical protein